MDSIIKEKDIRIKEFERKIGNFIKDKQDLEEKIEYLTNYIEEQNKEINDLSVSVNLKHDALK